MDSGSVIGDDGTASGDSRVRIHAASSGRPKRLVELWELFGEPSDMDAVILAPSDKVRVIDPARIRDIILVRVAVETRDMSRAEIAKDISTIVSARLSATECRHAVDRNLAALADAGLVTLRTVAVLATDAGRKRAQMVLGGKGALPKSWREARDVRLVARAIGLDDASSARLKLLLKADGLKAAIVQQAFGVSLRGLVTASRLRAGLAVVALERAFGQSGGGSPARKTGLSAKDGRKLASQLTAEQGNYGTDSRLIAVLAIQVTRAIAGDFASLQSAVLQHYVFGEKVLDDMLAAAGKRKPERRRRSVRRRGDYQAPVQLDLLFGGQRAEPVPVTVRVPVERAVSIARPDLNAFTAEVRRLADGVAEGWPGNRKAFINRVWRVTQAQRPEWGLSEIEFKAMLTEAHRAGGLALAHADLKDSKTLKDVQESQIAFKNTIFHFIRADG